MTLRRLLEAIAGPPTATTRRAGSSWREWHDARDLELANALLARLDHHARTFPAPSAVDDTVVRRAALDLIHRTA